MANRFTRWLHAGFAALFAAGVVVQAYLAGAALVQLGGGGDFGTHIEFGYTGMGILALGVLVSVVQAIVFTLLSAVYISMATAHEDH